MDSTRVIRCIVALVIVACVSGAARGQESPPAPGLPPVDTPPGLPSPPEGPTFAVCGAGATCDCANVVSVAQARDGQACTVTSSTGACSFQAREDEVGVCCVCRP